MKPVLKIEASKDAGLCLVTTEDGVVGFPDSAAYDEDQLGMLMRTDFTGAPYKYLPVLLIPHVRSLGDDWETIYTVTLH